jgi:hypothetical protein
MKTAAVIFADGSSEMRDAGARLYQQIEDLKIFDDVSVYDARKLSLVSERFKFDLGKIIKLDNFPLYFRAVKPWLVLHQMFESGRDFDLIFYIDAGCEVTNNFVSRLRLRRLLNQAYFGGGLAEETPYSEEQYTKSSLLKKFGNLDSIDSRGHIQDTWFILRTNESSRKLLLKWIELSDPDLALWQDPLPQEISGQTSSFIAHRHDQSIFSLLFKENRLPSRRISSEYLGKFGKVRGISIPIHGVRNRSGVSTLREYHSSDILSVFSLLINYYPSFVNQDQTIEA